MKIKNDPIHFISAHRTGTATLASFFSKFEIIKSEHQRKAHLCTNIIGNLHQRGLISDHFFRGSVDRLVVDYFSSNLDKKLVIETNGFNIFALPFLKQKIENLKIVHIIRDPFHFAVSMRQKRLRSPLKRQIQLHLPFWHPKPNKKIADQLNIKEMNETELLLWQWAAKNEFLHDHFHGSTDYKTVRFERLFSKSGRKEFTDMIEFCRLQQLNMNHKDLLKIKLNASKNYTSNNNDNKINFEECQRPILSYVESVKRKIKL